MLEAMVLGEILISLSRAKMGNGGPLRLLAKLPIKPLNLIKRKLLEIRGGTFVRLPGSKVLVPVEGISRIIRIE